jgi:hypothetical protein
MTAIGVLLHFSGDRKYAVATQRDYTILIGRLDKTLQQARRMRLDMLEHILQMALLEVAGQCGAAGRRQIRPPRRPGSRPN